MGLSDTMKPLFSWRGAICDSELPPATRLVALTLSLHMNERGGSAWPGATRLARETGLNVSTVKDRLRELERAGWLRCTSRGGVKGERRHASEFEATFPMVTMFDVPGVSDTGCLTDRVPETSLPGASDAPSTSKNSSRSREARARAERARRIPIPFVVSEGNRAWAGREIPGFDWDKEGPNFVDYWRAVPGAKGVKLDWDATWRTWMRRAASGVFR